MKIMVTSSAERDKEKLKGMTLRHAEGKFDPDPSRLSHLGVPQEVMDNPDHVDAFVNEKYAKFPLADSIKRYQEYADKNAARLENALVKHGLGVRDYTIFVSPVFRGLSSRSEPSVTLGREFNEYVFHHEIAQAEAYRWQNEKFPDLSFQRSWALTEIIARFVVCDVLGLKYENLRWSNYPQLERIKDKTVAVWNKSVGLMEFASKMLDEVIL